MRKNTFHGILYGASGSLWWGTIGVFYFKSSSFAGPIELVVHRTIWTAFSLIITTFLFKKLAIFFELLKKKKEMFYLLITGILIFSNWSTWIYAVVSNKIVDASFGYFIMPILSVFLGILFLKETYNKQKILSITLVLISIIYLLINYSSVPWTGLIVGITWSLYSFLRKVAMSAILCRCFAKRGAKQHVFYRKLIQRVSNWSQHCAQGCQNGARETSKRAPAPKYRFLMP